MTQDRGITEYRQWALNVLGLLAAAPEHQIAYLRESNVDSDEILLEFDDLLHVARARVADGSLGQEDIGPLLRVNEKVDSVNSGPDSIWSDSALEAAAQWRELRTAAEEAKAYIERSWHLDSGD